MRSEKAVAWSLVVLALLMSGASSLFELYDVFEWYDEVLHFYMSFAISLLLALYAYDIILTGHRRHEVLLVVAVAALGLAAGTIWEILEWLYDLYTEADSILGKTDTMVDLCLDLGGGVLAGIASLPMLRSRER